MPAKRPQPDPNSNAAKAVRKVTGGCKVRGKDLLGSPKLKRKLRETKSRV